MSRVRTKRILASLREVNFIFDDALILLLNEVAPSMFVCPRNIYKHVLAYMPLSVCMS